MRIRMLRDKRILWGSSIMICITLSLLLIQPGSVMLAESARRPGQAPASSAISLKRLQSSTTRTTRGAEEVSFAQNINDTPYPASVHTLEPTPTPIPLYISSFPTSVVVTPTPFSLPTATVSASPAAVPAVPTPPAQPEETATSTPTPTATPSPTPEPSPASSVTTTNPAVPSPTDP